MSKNAFATLLIGESYLPGTLTLGLKLRQLKTKHKLIILLDSDSISPDSLELIKNTYDEIIPIDEEQKLIAPLKKLKEELNRPELSITYSKLLLWDLDQFDNLVYLDSDVLPLKNIDDLFNDYDVGAGQIAASPDSGWPDIFNSGLFKLKPNKETFEGLLSFSSSTESFDGGDQGLLNEYFASDWIRLKYLYNVTPNYRNDYQYLPAFNRFFDDIKILHFVGKVKPWNYDTILSSDLSNFHNYWWNDFNKFFNHDQNLKYKLLNLPKGEAVNLKFKKTDNAWNKPGLDHIAKDVEEEQDEDHLEDYKPIFPWEGKSKPTRVFHKFHQTDDSQKQSRPRPKLIDRKLTENIETLKNTKISTDKSNSLQRNYGFENKNNDFDPDKALDEVSKLPFKFFERSSK